MYRSEEEKYFYLVYTEIPSHYSHIQRSFSKLWREKLWEPKYVMASYIGEKEFEHPIEVAHLSRPLVSGSHKKANVLYSKDI